MEKLYQKLCKKGPDVSFRDARSLHLSFFVNVQYFQKQIVDLVNRLSALLEPEAVFIQNTNQCPYFKIGELDLVNDHFSGLLSVKDSAASCMPSRKP